MTFLHFRAIEQLVGVVVEGNRELKLFNTKNSVPNFSESKGYTPYLSSYYWKLLNVVK